MKSPEFLIRMLSVCLLVLSQLQTAVHAQTGNIFLNSTGAGSAAILDPGNDDYITASGTVFTPTILDESDEFDAVFHEIWCYENEPTGDLQTGPNCGSTEIVDNPNTGKHAAYYRFIDPDNILDNGDELLVFRIRIGSNPGNAGFGYSILLDTDLGFGNTGPSADVNYMSGNPGFEFEVLFGSGNNNGIEVNDVDGVAAANQVTNLASYSTTQRHQRSYALLSNCGGTPVFMDFYINFSTLGISASTPLRMAFATSSSPNSALGGSASDIGGVDDDNYASDDAAFVNIINNSPVMSFSGGYECVATYSVSSDTSICVGDNISLAVNLTSPAAGVTYAWSTGATTSSINVSPTTTTPYFVSITDSVGTCEDSIQVSINNGAPCVITSCATNADTCEIGDTTLYSFEYTLLSEGFEVDSDGWTTNGAVTPAPRHQGGPILGANYFLGRFGSGQSVQKTFGLDNRSHRIAFDVYRLDSWDGENLQVYVGDGTQLLINQSLSMNSSAQTYTGTSAGYSFTMTSTPSINIPYLGAPGANAWRDQIIRVYIDVPSGISSLTLKVGSSLNQPANDESFGLDNFSITCTQFDVPLGVDNVDVYVVGGGGGGGTDGGAGGGGGEIRYGNIDVSAISTLTALPSRGGRGDIFNFSGSINNQGDASQIYNGNTLLYSANGGQGGGWLTSSAINLGGTGGSGGTGIQGASGGAGVGGTCSIGGSGGNGTQSDITCTNTYYAGGGGGGIGVDVNNATPFLGPSGGLGGGGRGANYRYAFDGTTVITGSTNGADATDGTGGGGGGGSACNSGTINFVNQRTSGGLGGSGTVIIRYAIVNYNAEITAVSTPSCNGDGDGVIMATASGGSANFNYYWSTNDSTINTSSTTDTLTGLIAGTYAVTVEDADGDTVVANFTLTEPAALNVSATVTSQETCVDANDGSVSLTVSGGTADSTKTFAFDEGAIPANINTYGNASFVSTGGVTGGRMRLVPNSSSAQGSFYIDSLVSTENHLNIGFDFKMASDGDGFHMALTDLANAQASPNQGEENIATNSTSTGFELAFEDIVTDRAYLAYNNVILGTHTFGSEVLNGPWHHVDVYLNNGLCTVVFNSTDTLFNGVTLTGFTPQNAYLKFAARNGAAASEQSIDNLTIWKPLLYNWSNGSVAQNLTGLAPGAYSVTVTDANGCTDSTSVNIIEYVAPTVLALDTVTSCAADSITLTANGTGTYLWSNGATTATISATLSDMYHVSVTDSNACVTVDSIAVSVINMNNLTADTAICLGDTITLSLLSGSGEATLIGMTQSSNYNDGCSQNILSALSDNDFNTAVSTNNGGSESITVELEQLIVVDSILIAPLTGCGWGPSYLNGKTVSVSPDGVTFTLLGSISGTQNNLLLNPGINFTNTAIKFIRFNSVGWLSLSEMRVFTQNGGNGFDYVWSTGDTTSIITVSPTTSSQYTLTVTDGINSCIDSVEVSVNNPAFAFNQDTVASCGLDTVTIDAGAGWASYGWSNGDTTQVGSFSTSGAYYLTVTDSLGCSASDTVLVSVINTNNGSNDTTICIGDTVAINSQIFVASDTIEFNYTGNDQTFTVPAGVTSINVVAWGAGGGKGGYSSSYAGGSGGFSSGTIAVTPGQQLKVVVGQGGIGQGVGFFTNGGSATYGGGGYGTRGDASGASGGGLTGIFLGSNPMTFDAAGQARAILIAGAGGGSCAYSGGGGAGGGTNAGETTGGNGATSTVAGSGTNGADGGPLRGGNGDANGFQNSSSSDGGGGGGGYFGGEGGFSDARPGGGGSGYLHPTLVSLGVTTTGQNGPSNTSALPPNTANTLYETGIAYGAYSSTGANGGNGKLIISYTGQQGISPSYAWSTGDTTAAIDVAPTSNSVYTVTVSDGISSCVDTIAVTVNNSNFSFPLDTITACGLDTVQVDAGAGWANYNWSTGDTTQVVGISTAGTYHVEVTDSAGCSASDTVAVSVLNMNNLTADTAICLGDSVTLAFANASIEGLVLYYPFDGNAVDEGPNGIDGTLNGVVAATTDRDGNANSALLFANNGADRNVFVNSPATFAGTTDFTYGFWVNPQALGLNTYFENGQWSGQTILLRQNNSSSIALYMNGSLVGSISYAPPLNQWTHLSLVRNGGLISLYVNGSLQGNFNTNYTNTFTPVLPMKIGSSTHTTGQLYRGSMDDFAIFNRALTAVEITSLYQNGPIQAAPLQYTWSTGDTTNAITVSPTTATQYVLTVSDGIGTCIDTVDVEVMNPVFSMGFDTTSTYAQDSILLDAGAGWSTYNWSTGETNQTAVITSSQEVTITVGDSVGCQVSDTVIVSVINLTNGSNDTTICLGDSITVTTGLSTGLDFTGLSAYYNFENTATDLSANANNLTVLGATHVTDVYGGAYSFDGNDRLSLPSQTGLPLGNSHFTITAYIKPTSMGSRGIVGWGTWGQNNRVNALRLTGNGLYNYWWGNDIFAPTANLSGQWHKVAVTFDGTTRRLFLNGVQIAQNTPVGKNTTFNDFNIGRTNNNEWFLGLIDNVSIWSRALSLDEINAVDGVINEGGFTFLWSTGDTTANITVDPSNNTSYTVTVSDGFTSAIDTISVAISAPTLSATIAPTDCEGTQNGSITTQVSGGTTPYQYAWSTGATSSNLSSIGVGTYNLTVTDSASCTTDSAYIIVDVDTIAPTAIAGETFLYLDGNGDATLTFNAIDSGSADNCGIDSTWISVTQFDCDDIGVSTMQLSVFDTAGNGDTTSFTLHVLDTIAPNVIGQNLTLYLDASGNVSITAAQVDNGTSDNCGIDTIYLSDYDFDCNDVGVNSVTFTAEDDNGNTKSETFSITVVDSISPVVLAQNLTVYLDASGSAVITPAQINNGSSDNCTIASYGLSTSSFNCADTGVNAVQLTVTDVNGNSSTASVTVTVLDTIAPSLVAQNVTVYLDGNGDANITTGLIDNGTADNCSIAQLTLSNSIFDCQDVGVNNIIFTAVDVNGNSSSANVVVTVLDTIVPNVIGQNLTVYLDASGDASITTAQVNNGTSDNCGIDTLYLSQYDFDCNDVGANAITLTAEDVNGNLNTSSVTVTVLDTIAPSVAGQNFSVWLDANGQASITSGEVNNGSNDNCGINTFSLSTSTFNCGDTGTNTVLLTVTDLSGNSASATVTIDVLDTMAPSLAVQNLSIYLDANGLASITTGMVDVGTTDNCGIDQLSLSATDFDCNDVGVNNVVFTAVDVNGNTNTANVVVTVLDTISPTAIAQNLTLYLDASGAATIAPAAVNNGSFDNCGISTLSLSQSVFGCEDVGNNAVVFTVTDDNGNTDDVTVTVDVLDTILPSVLTQNITVYLDSAGQVSILPNDIDDASFDNCAIDSMLVQPNAFNCGDTGLNTVVLTIWDEHGNSDSASAVVTVVDTVAPFVVTNNVLLTLDSNGQGTITVQDVDSIMSDACGIASTSLNLDSFSCSNIGSNTVLLTVTDVNGNSTIASAIVTVIDTVDPTALAQNLVIYLDATGSASVTPSMADSASIDNCAIDTMYVSKSDFNCGDAGSNDVTLFVLDGSGNLDSANFNVTVIDTMLPSIQIEDIIIALDSNGFASISVLDVDSGSVDNCAIDTLYLNQYDFECIELGVNDVLFYAQDVFGNLDSMSFTVTVIDTIAPVISARDTLIYLDADGSGALDPDWFDDGTTDNCTIDSIYLSQANMACENAGSNTITFYAVDQSGNVDSQRVEVVIIDTIAPSITCPVSFETCDTIVDFEAPVVFDACGIESLIQVGGLTSGSFFPEGITEITYELVDLNGNNSSCSFSIERYAIPMIQAPADTTVYYAEPVVLEPLDSLVVQYSWSPSIYLEGQATKTPTAKPLEDITYTVEGTSVNGCSASDEVSISVLNEIRFAQAFSPNGDGVNDVFHIEGIDLYPECKVTIVNRYGLRVFESIGYDEPWDGTFRAADLPVGSYFFVIMLDDGGAEISGTITIIR